MSRRSRSKSRTYYSQVGDQYVDTKSKQLLFQEAQVCTLGRTVLKGNEAFNENTANTLIEKHYKKRKSHGNVYCLVDRIRFQKNKGTTTGSYRKDLTYREIKHFYEFKSRPDMFMLAVEEENSGKRSYESFKCKKVEDVAILHDTIQRASNDPQYLLRNTKPLRQLSLTPPYSNESPRNDHVTMITVPERNRNISNLYTEYERPILYQRSPSPYSVRQTYRQTIPSRSPEEIRVYRTSRPVSTERKIEPRERSQLRASNVYPDTTTYLDEVTYLKADNRTGAQLSPNGPIYMYVSRTRTVDDNESARNTPYINNRASNYYYD